MRLDMRAPWTLAGSRRLPPWSLVVGGVQRAIAIGHDKLLPYSLPYHSLNEILPQRGEHELDLIRVRARARARAGAKVGVRARARARAWARAKIGVRARVADQFGNNQGSRYEKLTALC